MLHIDVLQLADIVIVYYIVYLFMINILEQKLFLIARLY